MLPVPCLSFERDFITTAIWREQGFFFFTLEIWTFVVSSHNKLQYQDPHSGLYTHIMNHKPSPNVLKYSPTWNQNKILNIIPLNIKIFPHLYSESLCFFSCAVFLLQFISMSPPEEFVFKQKLSSERIRNPRHKKKSLYYIKPAETCRVFKAEELRDKGQFTDFLCYLSHFWMCRKDALS